MVERDPRNPEGGSLVQQAEKTNSEVGDSITEGMLSHAELAAMEGFRRFHNLEHNTCTLKQVRDTPAGIVGWTRFHDWITNTAELIFCSFCADSLPLPTPRSGCCEDCQQTKNKTEASQLRRALFEAEDAMTARGMAIIEPPTAVSQKLIQATQPGMGSSSSQTDQSIQSLQANLRKRVLQWHTRAQAGPQDAQPADTERRRQQELRQRIVDI